MESEGMERAMEVTLETTFSAEHIKSVHIAANLRCDDDTNVEVSVQYEEEQVSHGQSFTSDAEFHDAPSTRVEINYVEKCF